VLTVNQPGNSGTVSGASPLCIGATSNYTSNGNTGGLWTSSNPAVAAVSATGMVTALTAGTTNITYKVTGCTGQVSSFKTLTVSPNSNAGTVTGNSPLCIGATSTYTSNGNTGGSWTSSNPGVASVSTTGMVTALTAGTTNITYTVTGCPGQVSTFKVLTVSSNANAGTVNGNSPLCIGATATYSTNGSAGGVWSSSNTAVATVNAAGLVTAISSGSTNITYKLNTGCNSPVSSFKTLTVTQNISAGTVSGTTPLCITSTASYTSNGSAGGTWTSSNPGVATVNTFGVVTALTPGTTNISYTVSSSCNPTVSAFKTLTVSQNATAGVVSGSSPLCIGGSALYTSNGNTGGTWTSSNTAVATVTASGLVTCLTAGTADITYRINTGCNSPVSSVRTLTVGSNTNAGTVNGSSPLCIGVTATYTSNGTSGGTWSSSNPAVATVTATGVVKALTAGTTNITYTVSSACGGQALSSKTLIVKPNANAGIVSGATPSCSLQTSLFTSNGDPGGTWSSSNPWVAYVWPTGHVTALFFGTANVIYTVNSGCNAPVSSYQTVTISLFPYAGIVSGNSPVCAGAITPYTSNGSAGGVWSSSNTSVATVNASGMVTTIGAGSAVITYTVRACAGLASASQTIIVTSTQANAGNITGPAALCINNTNTYGSNGTPGGTWSVANPAIATINPVTGFLTPLSLGTTSIIYTVTPACGIPTTTTKLLMVHACGTLVNNSTNSANSGKTVKLEAYPNPTYGEFTLVLKEFTNDKVLITVTDVWGKKVYQTEGPGQKQYTFGKNLRQGVYFVQVLQGSNKQSMKLVKE
jgi:uncharacterized protein YjdB